jgi:hypothetical protein
VESESQAQLPILHELQAKMKGRGIDTTLGLLGLKFEPQDVASTALGLATAASAVALPAAPASFLLLPLAGGFDRLAVSPQAA